MIQDLWSQLVVFEQMAEVFQRCGIRYALGGQIDANKPRQDRHVVEGVFRTFVGKVVPKLHEIEPQHALDTDGRAATFTCRVERFDQLNQKGPRNRLLHLREKCLASRLAGLALKEHIQKVGLLLHGFTSVGGRKNCPLFYRPKGLNLRGLGIKSAAP